MFLLLLLKYNPQLLNFGFHVTAASSDTLLSSRCALQLCGDLKAGVGWGNSEQLSEQYDQHTANPIGQYRTFQLKWPINEQINK